MREFGNPPQTRWGRKGNVVKPGPDPDNYPPIDPDEQVPDDPGILSPDTPETLPPAPVEPMPGPDDPDSVPVQRTGLGPSRRLR